MNEKVMKKGKRVRVLAESVMTGSDGSAQKLSHVGYGNLQMEEDAFSLSYVDRQGEEEIEIELICSNGHVQMRRCGDAKGFLSFSLGQKTSGVYAWAFGEMDIEVETIEMNVTCDEMEGSIYLQYRLYMGGTAVNEVDYSCKWKC